MFKNFDLRQKKVIDVDTAEKIGYIRDIDIDFESGKINSVSIPQMSIWNIFSRKESIIIPWENVISIGSEYIIIKSCDTIDCYNNLK